MQTGITTGSGTTRDMIIGKPYRIISGALLAGAATGLIVRLSHRPWLVIFFIPIYFVFEALISATDLWLRRTTKDRLWLWGNEGKEWLKTPKGAAWKTRTGYKK